MEKLTIHFSADGQVLTRDGGVVQYSSNTVDYVEAVFSLGDNWQGFDTVRAVFFTSDTAKIMVLDASGNCVVPAEVLAKPALVRVNLFGVTSAEGQVVDRLTTYPCVALIVDEYSHIDEDEEAITPSQFEQFVEQVSGYVTAAEQAQQKAEEAQQKAEEAQDNAEKALQELISRPLYPSDGLEE